MRTALCSLLLTVATAFGADITAAQLAPFFDGRAVRVVWKPVPPPDPSCELEIGEGAGHGGGLRWVRFRPGKTGVEVLSVRLTGTLDLMLKKGPPVVVERAVTKPETYSQLLHAIAIVDAAEVSLVPRNGFTFSSGDFWAHARMTGTDPKAKPLAEREFSGYEGYGKEAEYAQPKAAVALARKATAKLKFVPYELTAADRTWAAEKVRRDRDRFANGKVLGWVETRTLELAAAIGEKPAAAPLATPAAEPAAPSPTPGSRVR